MSKNDVIDAKYYQSIRDGSISERLVVKARDTMYGDFIRYCRPRPADTLLDVGVSDVINSAANMLEQKYPHADKITALGIGEGGDFRAAFPTVGYTQIAPNQRLPFADDAFDIACSNAVLEHVGSREHQLFFVRELTRVARRVFITVPHRYFPVEHHTAIPVLHHWNWSFRMACRGLKKTEWLDESNLILMSRRQLTDLVPASVQKTIAYTGIKLGPVSSNLLLFIERDRHAA